MGGFQIAFVSEILVSHHQCRCCTRSRTARSIYVAMIITIFAWEMAISFQQFQHTIHQRAHFHFPFLMLTTLTLLISQIMKHGIHRFRLFANTMYDVTIGRNSIRYTHLFLEISLTRKTILKPTIENSLSHLYQSLVSRLFSVFQRIESIQQHPSAKTELHMVARQTIVTSNTYARMIFQRIFVNIRLTEIICQLCFYFRW